jgi:hypothetical protein
MRGVAYLWGRPVDTGEAKDIYRPVLFPVSQPRSAQRSEEHEDTVLWQGVQMVVHVSSVAHGKIAGTGVCGKFHHKRGREREMVRVGKRNAYHNCTSC